MSVQTPSAGGDSALMKPRAVLNELQKALQSHNDPVVSTDIGEIPHVGSSLGEERAHDIAICMTYSAKHGCFSFPIKGNVCAVANSYLNFNRPKSFLGAMTFGNCGYATPAAVCGYHSWRAHITILII